MQTILERNQGVVKCGNATATIPNNRSALSMIADNGLIDGGIYENDGWVYFEKKGKKIRVKKWYREIDGVRIWEPVLNDIPKLENRYQKQIEALHNFYTTVELPIMDELFRVGKAHAKINHTHTGDQHWWLYHVTKDAIHGDCFGFDWVDEPEKPLNLEIGQKFYDVDRINRKYCKRLFRFRLALEKAFDRLFFEKLIPTQKDVGRVLKLNINGRAYWFRGINRPIPWWEKIAWADEPLKNVDL